MRKWLLPCVLALACSSGDPTGLNEGTLEVRASTTGSDPDPDGYKVQFSGPHKWRVLSPAGSIVGKGYATREDALAALAEIKPKRAA